MKAQFVRSVKKDQKIFSENDRSRDLYFIEKGSVRILKNKDGKKMELALLKEGAIFGEMALLDGKPRSASAVANEDCQLTVVSEQEFNKKIENVPNWYLSLIRIASERLRQINDQLNFGHRLHNIANIAQLLVLIIKKHQYKVESESEESKQAKMDSKFAKTEIMEILGLNKNPMKEGLEFLEKKDLILMYDNELTIHNPEELLNYANFLRNVNWDHEFVLMNDEIFGMLSNLKTLLVSKFAKSDVVTFSYANFLVELEKNVKIPEGKETWFLNTSHRMSIVKFIHSNGTEANSIEKLDSGGQLRFDSTYLTQVLQEEMFKRLGVE